MVYIKKAKNSEQKRYENAVLNSFNCTKATAEHKEAAEIITRRTAEAVSSARRWVCMKIVEVNEGKKIAYEIRGLSLELTHRRRK